MPTTAASPYAPPRRNSFLRRASSGSIQSPSSSRGPAVFAFMLMVIRFWKETIMDRQRLSELYQRRHGLLDRMIGWLGLTESSGERIPSRSTETPLEESGCSIVSRTVRQNQKAIREVLQYWFGQYPPDKAQKMLWMIASSSKDQRRTVDREICERFQAILVDLASLNGSNLWDEWCLDPELYGVRGKIAAITVLDQFSRHIHRHYDGASLPAAELPSQKLCDRKALETAKLVLQDHQQEVQCGIVPLPMYIFALMPYRHANNLATVEYVQRCVESAAGMGTQLVAMLGRFRNATNRRMAILQDEARRTGNVGGDGNADVKQAENEEVVFSDEDILESCYFEADMIPSSNHACHRTVVDFLASRGIRPIARSDSNNTGGSSLIVSLSGGVDSMVIASILAYLASSREYRLRVVAVHIDYANRPESGAEADFVKKYCEKLGILFRCRRIGEVTRGITARDDYERIARDIRYQSYKDSIAFCKESNGGEKSQVQAVIGVMLGHHRGDLRENVLSNAHKGCGPLDLSGMTAVSKNDGVTVYRPLLALEKEAIFDYAHKFGVPYFKDTTPHWSTRGKLRNQLLPLLQQIYGDGSMNNLSNLANESDECRDLLFKSTLSPFFQKVVHRPMGIYFETAPWRNQPEFFWKFVLRETLHGASFGMFSDKSVTSFLDRVLVDEPKASWLQCRKDYGVFLQEDGRVFVLFPDSFPWQRRDMYDMDREAVPYGEDMIVGPWIVKSEIAEVTSDSLVDSLLAKKAVPSMEVFMNGEIVYYVKVPMISVGGQSQPKPLVFCKFSKQSRPIAWKSSDLKLQITLPLLGNNGSDPPPSEQAQLARVSIRLSRNTNRTRMTR